MKIQTAFLTFSIVAIIVGVQQAIACKDLLYPKQLDKEIVSSYPEIYVADVEQIQPLATNSRYVPPFKATFKVIKTLKGERKPGTTFEAQTSGEEASARCPIKLTKGTTYLLFFNRNGNRLELPRYSSYFKKIVTSEGDTYIQDIEKIVTAGTNK